MPYQNSYEKSIGAQSNNFPKIITPNYKDLLFKLKFDVWKPFNFTVLDLKSTNMFHICLGTLHPYYSRAGELQFCSTNHFYSILDLISMNLTDFHCKNHHTFHFFNFSNLITFYHFLFGQMLHQNSYVKSIGAQSNNFPEIST